MSWRARLNSTSIAASTARSSSITRIVAMVDVAFGVNGGFRDQAKFHLGLQLRRFASPRQAKPASRPRDRSAHPPIIARRWAASVVVPNAAGAVYASAMDFPYTAV